MSPFCRKSHPYFAGAFRPVKQVPGSVIDMNVLLACQLLLEQAFSEGNSPLLHQLYQYLLFDFNIWAKSHFTVCLGMGGNLVIIRQRVLMIKKPPTSLVCVCVCVRVCVCVIC